PAAAMPLPVPTPRPAAAPSDEFLGALWRLQERIDQLEHENRRLTANVDQLQGAPAYRGRSSRFFQVSPLRNPALGGLGPVPGDYHAELAAHEQITDPHAAVPEGAGFVAGGCACADCAALQNDCYGTGAGGHGFGCEGVFEFSIDWLNWKANRNGLDFIITGDDANDAIGPGSLKFARPGRDNGLRLALFRRATSGWDFGLRYTEFDAQGRNSASDPDGVGNMTATRIHPTGAAIGDADITTAKTKYKLQYDLVDVEAGRWFGLGSPTAIRPFAAIRSARIDQDQHSRYSDTPGLDSGNLVFVRETANMSSVGLVIGSEAHWHVRGCFRAFGRAAAGLHVGTFDISNFQFEPDNIDDINVQVRADRRDVVMSYELAAGIGARVWDRRPAAVDLEIGYELHYWDNLADFIRFVDDANDGLNDRSTVSLGLDGLFGRIVITR
ncbi:MAG TPA: Lpg1974 family pore-forming outer membrane protein, partial [Planctomycetaceae bacterium]|nr:Lpg1974 family pore-forming outer membrane protein [Planctomycetaceae bacterium]